MSKYKAVIFDLDDTIINTSKIKHLRRRPWDECYKNIPTKTFAIFDGKLSSLIEDKKFKIGIVTNSPRPYATRVLSHHKFDYDNLICFHDCDKRKPHPDPLLKCALNLEINPNSIISIGDNVYDIVASKEAGMTTVGVTWGESSQTQLEDIGSDFIVSNTIELINLIRDL
jgi:HAD superfamily hydrolase (TIGR01509 family)